MGLFACALLSKSATCLLPAALLVALWWKQPRIHRRDLLALTPMLALGVLFVLVTVYLEAVHGGVPAQSFATNTSTAVGGFIRPGAVERFDRMVNTLAERIVAGI